MPTSSFAGQQPRQPTSTDVLTKLKELDSSSGEFETTFAEFSAKVHEHAASEETEVLALLTSTTTADQRQQMGEAFIGAQHGVSSHR